VEEAWQHMKHEGSALRDECWQSVEINRDSASQLLFVLPDEVALVLETDLLVTGAIEGIPFLYLTIILDSPFFFGFQVQYKHVVIVTLKIEYDHEQ